MNDLIINPLQIPIERWSVKNVYQWLVSINLQTIAALISIKCEQIARHYVDGISLIQLDINQLIYFGISQSQIQQQILAEIQHLKNMGSNSMLKENNINKSNRNGTSKFKEKKIIQKYDDSQQMIVRCKFNMNSYALSPNEVYIIGNHYQNHIRCMESTVQEYHSEISFMNHHFYIRDLGTTHGTYIKIARPFKLEQNMLFQIGQILIEILLVNSLLKLCKIKAIYNRKKQQFTFTINLSTKNYFRIGRRSDNDFSLNDEFLCQLHAKIFMIGQDIMLQDLGSINGTWMRLSKSKVPSQFYKLENKVIFKVGWCISYECEIKDNEKRKELNEDSKQCFLCCKNDKNILYLPCRHFISCEVCSPKNNQCSMCSQPIQSTLKIFTT